MKRDASRPRLVRAVVAAASAVSLVALAPRAHAAEPMAATLCEILRQLNPQVKAYQPEGARAQLVMAVAEKYEADATQLRQVRARIDQVTTASCPKEREAMLGATKTRSLADALS